MPRSSRAGWASRASPAAKGSRSTDEARTLRIGGHDLREGDTITIDGGTGRVIVGSVALVPPQINEDFETVLAWADDVRRLKVRTNADNAEDSAKAREFGAQGIGLCRTEHMFFGDERLPVMQEMILASDEEGRRAALERLLPFQQSDFEAIFEAMAGLPVTIRLLDPPLHEFLPSLEEATDERMRSRIRLLTESNPMLGTRGCRLGIQWPEIYEMQVRAIARAARAVQERTGDVPLVEIMHPLVCFREELRRLRELTVLVMEEEAPELDYLCGTMIELPRAALRAGEIAEVADFFSFGTNDLTQTTLGMSRDDAEGKFLTFYLEDGVIDRNPFETLDQDGVGDLMQHRRRARAQREAGDQARHLRRARRRAEVGGVLPPARARLRQLLAVPRAARAARRSAGCAEGGQPRRVRRRRRLDGALRIVDRRATAAAKASSEADVRRWLADYRDEHADDDPDAVHVQVLRRSTWSFLMGGTLVPREDFLDGGPLRSSTPSSAIPRTRQYAARTLSTPTSTMHRDRDDAERRVHARPLPRRRNANVQMMPAIRPPTWPPHEMPGDREADHEVEDDPRHRGAHQPPGDVPLDHEQRAEDPEDRA